MGSIAVLWEYQEAGVIVRAVRGADGLLRLERKGLLAKKFKAVTWNGSGPDHALDSYRSDDYRAYLRKTYPLKKKHSSKKAG